MAGQMRVNLGQQIANARLGERFNLQRPFAVTRVDLSLGVKIVIERSLQGVG